MKNWDTISIEEKKEIEELINEIFDCTFNQIMENLEKGAPPVIQEDMDLIKPALFTLDSKFNAHPLFESYYSIICNRIVERISNVFKIANDQMISMLDPSFKRVVH